MRPAWCVRHRDGWCAKRAEAAEVQVATLLAVLSEARAVFRLIESDPRTPDACRKACDVADNRIASVLARNKATSTKEEST